jgi:large conductance mechanosensitive channel
MMPPFGPLLHHVDFAKLFIALDGNSYPTPEAAKAAGAVTLNYGIFINTIIEFLIVAFSVFLLIRTVNRWTRKPAPAAAPTTRPCPYCYSEIPLKATRCPHCTANVQPA